jgi:hypothetical protein
MAIKLAFIAILGLCWVRASDLSGEEGGLRVRAYVDGKSRLVVTPNAIRWDHLEHAKPGQWSEKNEPTYVNGYAWIPTWPSSSATAVESSSPLAVNLSLSGSVEITKVAARWQVEIIQQPAADNGFTLVIEFNDDPPGIGGPAWYEVILSRLSVAAVPRVSPAFLRSALTNWTAWGAGTSGLTGDPHFGQSVAPPGTNIIVKAEAGGLHNVALRSDRTVLCWGRNLEEQCKVPVGLSGVKDIDAGHLYTLALKFDGTVSHWGLGMYGMRPLPGAVTNVVAIAAGGSHCLALRNDGRVIAWGWNGWGQTNVPDGLSNVVTISAGNAVSAVLRADGTVVSWGGSGLRAPLGLSSVVQISCGSSHVLALRQEGTVVAWGMESAGPATKVPVGLKDVIQVSAGVGFSIALTRQGEVIAWGRGETHQTTYYDQSTIPATLGTVRRISAGNYHTLAELGDPTPLLLGDSDNDQLSEYAEIARLGTDPLSSDSDGDGYPDGLEMEFKSSPVLGSRRPGVTWIDPRFSVLTATGFAIHSINASPNQTTIVEASGDLVNWESLIVLQNSPLTTEFLDPTATKSKDRFYRIRH